MRHYAFLFVLAATLLSGTVPAQVPPLVNYQGRVAVDAVNFEGAGQFKFAIVNSDGTITFWSNDGTSAGGSEPATAVTLTVEKGLYSVLLGDIKLGNMTALPPSAFAHPDIRLRVWFDDGVNGSQLLAPDQRLAPSAYLSDGAVTTASIADRAVTTEKIAKGAVTGSTIAPSSIEGANIAPASLNFNHLTVPVAPEAGQVLGFDGTTLNWTAPGAGDGVWTVDGALAYRLGDVAIGTATPNAGYRLAVNGLVQFTPGGSGGAMFFGTPNFETGMTWANANTRADLRFDGSTVKLLAGAAGGPPGNANGIAVTTAGNVGIGTTGPASKLDVNGDVTSTRLILRADPAAPSNAAVLCPNAGVTTFVPYNTATNRPLSLLVRDASVRVLTIYGGADLAEPFAMSEGGVPAGAVVIIDPQHPGKLKRSVAAYDRKVAGIVSGANGIKPGISMIDEAQLEAGENVALSGRVYVNANTSAGRIAPGDLLTTSDVPGEAMKAANHQRTQGSILGKAMTSLDEPTGTVLVLVTLQ